MTDAPERTCDLCDLPMPKEGFFLKTVEGERAFCCESCRGIWRMLNPGAEAAPEDKGKANDEQRDQSSGT